MNADEREFGRARVSLATVFWAVTVLSLLLALVVNNVMLRQELRRLDHRMTEMEAGRLLTPLSLQVSNVGVPLDVDRAMQMNSSNLVR